MASATVSWLAVLDGKDEKKKTRVIDLVGRLPPVQGHGGVLMEDGRSGLKRSLAHVNPQQSAVREGRR